MEAAAKTVELLTQRTLPDRPYYLSNSPAWRYRPPADGSRRFEELHCTRLQYSTLLNEADRGVLLTRPDYDMREEPPKPVAREISSLAKAGGEKKKLSLSDYKNKKTTATASASPPEPAIAKMKEAERAGASNPASPAASAPRSSDGRPHTDPRRSLDSRPSSESRRPRDSDPATDGKQRSSRDSIPAVDMSLPPKPPTSKYGLPPRPPSPASKKRVGDHEDDSRPQKRSKAENGRVPEDRATPRDDYQRKKEPFHRDSPLLNGKSSFKGTPRSRSPASRPPGDSANGARSHGSGSNKVTPTKEANKTVIPPLLSPLHRIFDDDHASPPKNERKRSDDRSRNPESPPEEKRPKKTSKLPPLLSPTLPPVVEAALRRKKRTSHESDDDERESSRESPVKNRKRAPSPDDSEEEQPLARPKKQRMVVTIRIPKSQRKMVKRILAMPPSRDNGGRNDYERATDDERSVSRKRPPNHTDALADSVAMKKSRSSDIPSTSRPLAPTTPPRKSSATAMSRANSNNSVALTPGDTINATPSTAGHEPSSHKQDKPDAKTLREKEVRLLELGRRLKHEADLAMNGRSPAASKAEPANSSNSNNHGRSSSNTEQANRKLGYILSLESTMAFMQAFQAQNQQRGLHAKKLDPAGWASLFPFIDYLSTQLQRHLPSRRYSPPYALLQLLQAMAVDELMKCYLSLDDASAGQLISLADIIKYERRRSTSLVRMRDMTANIDNPRLRAEVPAWATLDDVTEVALRVMRRWCAEEDVTWTTDIQPRDYGK